MFPTFRYDLKGRAVTAGIIAVLLSVTVTFMPFLLTTMRSNKVFLLGAVTLFVLAVLVYRYTIAGSMLVAYTAAHIFLSASESVGSAMYQFLCFGGLFLLAISTYDTWRDYKGGIYNAICIIALANVAVQCLQWAGVHYPRGFNANAHYGLLGLMANVNETSALLACCLPFFFRRRWAWFIPSMVLGLALARTTNGMMAAGVVSAIWLMLNCKRWGLVILAYALILAGGAVYVFQIDPFDLKTQLHERGRIFGTTAMASAIKPLGWGFGQFDSVMPLLTYAGTIGENHPLISYLASNVTDKDALDRTAERLSGQKGTDAIRAYVYDKKNSTIAMFIQAHNDYLEFAFAAGFAGLGFLLLFLASSLVRGFRKRDKLPVLGLLASSLTACLFFSWQIIPIAAVTLICVVICNIKEEQRYV